MLKATWDWYYGSTDEEVIADCKFGIPFLESDKNKDSNPIVRPGTFGSGESVNVFTLTRQIASEPFPLEICAKHLKVLRHPNILRFISSIPVDSEFHLVTEHAYPLQTLLSVIDANEVCSGLHDITLALQFIHEKAGITHNNLSVDVIFVKDSGPWKLGGFDYACRFDEATTEQLQENPEYSPPPEEKGPNKVNLPLKKEYGHCRDVYSFGLLLERFLEQVQFSANMLKKNIDEIIEDLTREDYENRPTVKEILTMSIFKSGYISIVHFLQSVTLRSKSEKDIFFKSLLSQLVAKNIFSEVVGRRIIPLLFTPIVLAEQCAVNHVIKDILSPASETISSLSDGVLPESIFARYVIPKIVELFKSRLIHVRLVLIENFAKYVHLFEKSVLTDIVLPEIVLGLHDANNQLVQGSLHALADAVAVVGADVIVGTEREKMFSPGVPKFDGRALNESQALAYKEKLPPRKKVEKKKPPEPPRKMTLLELAMMKKIQADTAKPIPDHDVLLKQQQFAHALVGHSQVTSNGHTKHSSPSRREPAPVRKSTRPKIVEQVVKQPDIETWASTDEDENGDMDWPEMTEESTPQDEDSSKPLPPTHMEPKNKLISNEEDSQRPNKLVLTKPKSKPSIKKTSRSLGSSPVHSLTSQEGKHSSDQLKLGQEFEITAVQITSPTRVEEPDFFADMVPEIKTTPKLTAGRQSSVSAQKSKPLSNGNKDWESRSASSTFSSAFNAPLEDADADGWGDDAINWE